MVGVPHDVKGQSLFAYVTLTNGFESSKELVAELNATVKKYVGSFAKPDDIIVAPAVPKTRSGKIMRRLLRKIACGEKDLAKLGDISTLADPSVVERLIKSVGAHLAAKKK